MVGFLLFSSMLHTPCPQLQMLAPTITNRINKTTIKAKPPKSKTAITTYIYETSPYSFYGNNGTNYINLFTTKQHVGNNAIKQNYFFSLFNMYLIQKSAELPCADY